MQLENVIIKPLITEKVSEATEKFNRYGFVVQKGANKNQIKAAVEKMYDVRVLNLRTAIIPGKLKKVGRSVSKTSSWKKVLVQLEEGQKIEFFKGV